MDIVILDGVVKMNEKGKRLIHDVHMTIDKGDNAWITGMGGSGIDILLRLVTGMDTPSAGSIVVDGADINDMDEEERAVFRNLTFGFLSHRPHFLDILTVTENVSLPLTLRKSPVRVRQSLAMEAMDQFGIRALAHRYPGQLSALDLQLAGLARCMLTKPKILLLDHLEMVLSEAEQEKLQESLCPFFESEAYTVVCFSDRIQREPPFGRCFAMKYGTITEELL